MANYYKLSNGKSSILVCEASLSESLSAMFLFSVKQVSVEKVSPEQYVDYKAQEFINNNSMIEVHDMFTKSGLPVSHVKFADVDDGNAMCHYIVIENGYKSLRLTDQKNLLEGEI